MSDRTCPELKGDWYGTICGNPAKYDDGLCGIHHTAKVRRDRNNAERARKAAEMNARTDRTKTIAKRLTELDIPATHDMNGVRLSVDVAETLITRLEELS